MINANIVKNDIKNILNEIVIDGGETPSFFHVWKNALSFFFSFFFVYIVFFFYLLIVNNWNYEYVEARTQAVPLIGMAILGIGFALSNYSKIVAFLYIPKEIRLKSKVCNWLTKFLTKIMLFMTAFNIVFCLVMTYTGYWPSMFYCGLILQVIISVCTTIFISTEMVRLGIPQLFNYLSNNK